MGPLLVLSINNQALTVLEDRLQIQTIKTMRKDETASNRERLLTASGATPIGSTAVPPVTEEAVQERSEEHTSELQSH